MQLRELAAPARVEGTMKGDLNGLPQMMALLQQFGADIGCTPAGPPVLRFTHLADAVDSITPQTEVYIPVTADEGMPEGGEGVAIVRTVPCRVASRMVHGSLLHPLPELLELKQWAEAQNLKLGATPGAILHTPDAPLDNQQFELFYPILPNSPLPSGTYSLCSPPIGATP